MRYYIYLDKDFLKSIYSSISSSDFDIGIVEFSSQKSYSVTNGSSAEPCIENRKDIEELKANEKNSLKKNISNGRYHKLIASLNRSDTYQTATTKKYINIEDISQIKNNNFYHNLVVKLVEDFKDEKKLCFEYGNICPCKLNNRFKGSEILDSKSCFLKLNNTYIWLNSEKIETDTTFLCNIVDKVNVIGYEMYRNDNLKVIKAIAIYIE